MEDFDWEFYIFLYDDLKNMDKESAFKHYTQNGILENRVCNQNNFKNFNWELYTKIYDLKSINNKNEAIKDYLLNIKIENRNCNKDLKAYFDWKFYIFLYDDLKNITNEIDALKHFLNYGVLEDRVCNQNNFKNFNWELYTKIYDLKSINNKNEAIKDYLLNIKIENRNCNKDLKAYFDWKFYIFLYDDLKNITNEIDALKHFLNYGILENRICNNNIYKRFDWELYVNLYHDLKNIDSKDKAYKHYITYGINEQRIFNKDNYDNFDWEFYLTLYTKNNLKSRDDAYNHWTKNIDNAKKRIEYNNLSKKYSTFITFIITTTGKRSLLDTINSLTNLKDSNWKAIILFDNVNNNFQINDSRISIFEIKNEKNDCLRNFGFKYVNDSEWIGFLNECDTISEDYIINLRRELLINNSIHACVFRMIDENNLIIPTKHDFCISKCNIGMSFAIKSNVIDNVLFRNNINNMNNSKYRFEDYYFLKELEFKRYNIVISLYICYFSKCKPYNITQFVKELTRLNINF